MSKLEDKHLEHIAKMQAIADYSWHSWNSPIGLAVGLLGLVIFLNGLGLLAILIRYFFMMR